MKQHTQSGSWYSDTPTLCLLPLACPNQAEGKQCQYLTLKADIDFLVMAISWVYLLSTMPFSITLHPSCLHPMTIPWTFTYILPLPKKTKKNQNKRHRFWESMMRKAGILTAILTELIT